MKRVVMFSGGVSSWATARIVADEFGTDDMVLLFADTRVEDEDCYRFLVQAASNIGVPLTVIADGRTPFQLFMDEGLIANSQKDLCSRILKRELMRSWLAANCDPADTIIYLGISHEEGDRFARAKHYHLPWIVEAPLCDPPYHSKCELLAWLEDAKIKQPRLYSMGFGHNNCGGACVKAGQGQWYKLWKHLPERYADWEANEEAFRAKTGKDVSILRDRRGGNTKPLTLRDFRLQLEAGYVPKDKCHGCNCMLPLFEMSAP